jgi:hypothetical protein
MVLIKKSSNSWRPNTWTYQRKGEMEKLWTGEGLGEKVVVVVTQNIDGLMAHSKFV